MRSIEKIGPASPLPGRKKSNKISIHGGILNEIDDEVLEAGWVFSAMYRMVGKARRMIPLPDPIY